MSKQTDNKQFWQRWASCYGPLMQSSEPLYAAIAQQMQPHLTPEMNVLELACGSGQLSFRLSRLVRDWEATEAVKASERKKAEEMQKKLEEEKRREILLAAQSRSYEDVCREAEGIMKETGDYEKVSTVYGAVSYTHLRAHAT